MPIQRDSNQDGGSIDAPVQVPGVPGMDRPYKWDLEDKLELEDRLEQQEVPAIMCQYNAYHPKFVPQLIRSHQVPPLIKRATAIELRPAGSIVTQTPSESQKLNKARVANPLYNKCILRPGTRVSGGTAPNDTSIQSINKDVPPFPTITEELPRRP